jgi:hypothetical protein
MRKEIKCCRIKIWLLFMFLPMGTMQIFSKHLETKVVSSWCLFNKRLIFWRNTMPLFLKKHINKNYKDYNPVTKQLESIQIKEIIQKNKYLQKNSSRK